jgi:hypothetical protein
MNDSIQASLFEQIRLRQKDQSLVDEIAKLLSISTDSAYRRIRDEKTISLEETKTLCNHYRISLDNLMNLSTNTYSFTGDFVDAATFRFEEYLKDVVQQVKYMNGFEKKQMIYLCKDIPLFHHFHFRELAAFKHYFWMKNILHHPSFIHAKFRMADYPDEYFELGKRALQYYNQLDSIELWNIESINSTIRQVEYYRETDAFADPSEMMAVYEALEKLAAHLQDQAALGFKFDAATGPAVPCGSFQMYFNEIVILENSIMVTLNETKAAFLVHNVLNFMITHDVHFCEKMQQHIDNLIRKSTLISTFSERERARFFKYLHNRIKTRKHHLSS